MPFKYIAYWLNNEFTLDRVPVFRKLESSTSSNTVFPPVGSVPWTAIGGNLYSTPAFVGASFTLSDVQTSPANNEHVIVIGAISQGFYGIALSKDAGATWVGPTMPSLANYNSAAQAASSGLFPAPFDMTSCGYLVTASNKPTSVHWFDNTTIYVTAGPYVLKCTNWQAYVSGANPSPVFTVASAIYDTLTPDTQAIPAPVACSNVKPSPTSLTSIYFESATSGVCTSDNGVFTTNDAGVTWQKISDDSLFQSPTPVIFSTILPWKIGAWGVRSFIGSHKNGNDIIVVSQNYIIKGTTTNGGITWNWQPVSCSNPTSPLSGNPPCPPISNNRWRSLNWFKNSSTSFTYYVTGTNNKVYTSSNGTTWSPWVNPDTLYTTGEYPDYQDIAFYTSTQCFYAVAQPATPGTNPSVQIINDQGLGSPASSDIWNGLASSVPPGVTPQQRYMAVWVGETPQSGGGGGGTTEVYVLTNCNSQATPLVTYTTTDLSDYVNNVISNFTINGQTTMDCYTVSGPSQTSNPTTAVAVDSNTVIVYPPSSTPSPCLQCTSGCYKLIACDDPSDYEFVYTQNPDLVDEMSPAIYQTIQTPYICENKCYYVVPCSGIPSKPPINLDNLVSGPDATLELTVYVSCAQCNGMPPQADLKPRAVKPGFYTPGCPPEYTVKTSCMYGEQLYDEMVAVRYGIEICCDHDVDKWDIKKQLLELKAIYDECACANTITPCPVCVAPCNVTAEATAYELVNQIEPPPPCNPPVSIKVGLVTLGP